MTTTGAPISASTLPGTRHNRRRVILDHDGSLDDLLALLLISHYDDIELAGVVVSPGDCIPSAAVSATHKILRRVGRDEVPVFESPHEGPNPFPMSWRVDALRIDDLPALNDREEDRAPTVSRALDLDEVARWILDSSLPVTFVVTGPLTTLALLIDRHPDAAKAINEVLWMGGAFDVPGNVDEAGHDGTAEWNVYYDPGAAAKVLASGLRVTVFGLDVTDHVAVTPEVTRAYADRDRGWAADLAGTFLAMTAGAVETTGMAYCCWDTLTAAYLGAPELFTFVADTVTVRTNGADQGRTVSSGVPGPVKRAVSVDAEGFFRHLREVVTRGR